MNSARSGVFGCESAPVVVSLQDLAGDLAPWPVRPLALVELLADPEGFRRFQAVVKEIFPQEAGDILYARPRPEQSPKEAIINAFLERVQAHYFPVVEFWDDDDTTFGDFLDEVALAYDSWDDDRLHTIPDLPSKEARLMAGLLTPFLAETVGGEMLADMLAQLCGPEVLRWVPTVQPRDRERWLLQVSTGPYPAVSDMYRWVFKETGCAFLDYDPEDWGGQTGLAWDLPTLRWLRDQYQESLRIRERIHRLGGRLAEDRALVIAVLQRIYREELAQHDPDQHTTGKARTAAEARAGVAQLALPVGGAAGSEHGGPATPDAALPS